MSCSSAGRQCAQNLEHPTGVPSSAMGDPLSRLCNRCRNCFLDKNGNCTKCRNASEDRRRQLVFWEQVRYLGARSLSKFGRESSFEITFKKPVPIFENGSKKPVFKTQVSAQMEVCVDDAIAIKLEGEKEWYDFPDKYMKLVDRIKVVPPPPDQKGLDAIVAMTHPHLQAQIQDNADHYARCHHNTTNLADHFPQKVLSKLQTSLDQKKSFHYLDYFPTPSGSLGIKKIDVEVGTDGKMKAEYAVAAPGDDHDGLIINHTTGAFEEVTTSNNDGGYSLDKAKKYYDSPGVTIEGE